MNYFCGGCGARVHFVTRAVKVLFVYPVFLVPLLISWLCAALVFIWVAYLYPWETWPQNYRLLIGIAVALGMGLVITMACHVSLELIQQIEEGRPVSLFRATLHAMGPNLIHSLPIVFAWVTLWSVLTAIGLVLGGEEEEGSDGSEMRRALMTVAGESLSFSFSRAYLGALSKTLRMTVFLILPSIAWERDGPFRGAQRGFTALRSHTREFATGIFSSEFVMLLLIIPAAILLSIAGEFDAVLPVDSAAVGIIYFAFVWTFVVYVEQMFAAEFYLWHRRWEAARAQVSEEQRDVLRLDDVLRPSLLDQIPEMAGQLE